MAEEIWKKIPSWPGYEASNLGRIRRGDRIKATEPDRKGYRRLKLWSENKSKTCFVHRLVAEAFNGARPEGEVCRHINGEKSDNRPENLCYGTPSQNEADKVRHGTAPIGERHPAAKLSLMLVAELRGRYVSGCRKNGSYALAREYDIPRSTVWRVVSGASWHEVASTPVDA